MEPSHDDGFKWFGQGFDGFPKILPDDTVEYAAYVIDKTASQQRVSARLKEVQQDANQLVKDLLKDYIWQRDAFALELKPQNGRWSLLGSTNYGDSVADEWLIVYLLRSLSLKNPDIWIRVYDTDGEFLLIEAANALPRWVKPEIAANRVWIHAGSLRLIPRQASRALENRAPTLDEALAYIGEKQQTMVHSPMIEAEAFYRLNKYPKAIEEQFHHSIVTIPKRVAYLLKQNPAYVSAAIEAFYLRDPILMTKLRSTDQAALIVPPVDLINVSVRFPKVGFAQIRSQEFDPPECWQDKLDDSTISTKDRIRLDTGMKLTCGFEMLLDESKLGDRRAVREIRILIEDVENGDEDLPSDNSLLQWNSLDDDESWMNIDFSEFDKELSGKASAQDTSFGDKEAQEQLRKMVSRFEDFLNDDRAGIDGADLDDDDDENSDDYDTEDSEDELRYDEEDREVSFDEVEFARAMRQMMGLPPEEEQALVRSQEVAAIDDTKVIEALSAQMERELKETGVLKLNAKPTPRHPAITSAKTFARGEDEVAAEDTVADNDEEVNIDFELAQNMLEAFKSQGGMAGPAGNLMNILGVSMPPDKDK